MFLFFLIDIIDCAKLLRSLLISGLDRRKAPSSRLEILGADVVGAFLQDVAPTALSAPSLATWSASGGGGGQSALGKEEETPRVLSNQQPAFKMQMS